MMLWDNGNLRSIWDGSGGNHFGLEFLGDGMLRFVIFQQRTSKSSVGRGQDAPPLMALNVRYKFSSLSHYGKHG